MQFIQGDDRRQVSFLPPAIEEYVGADALVRVVDAFVGSLDFRGLGFERAIPATTGRPGYDPRDMLRLYLYGYINEVRSSRRLERESRRDVEVMWLVRRLTPDFKTIADFRRDNGPAIIAACRAFVLFSRTQGLLGSQLVAIDGSKFRAVASPKRVVGRREIGEAVARIDAQVASYLARMDETDAAEPDEAAGAVSAALTELAGRRAELDRLSTWLETEERTTIVEGEPDARPMGSGIGQKPPSYNMQSAVDPVSGIIIHHDVITDANDFQSLHTVALAAKAALGVDALRVVADTGYSSGVQAAACEADGIEPCAPAHRAVNNQGAFFDRSAFTYDREADVYICPGDRSLTRRAALKEKPAIRYMSTSCSGCELKPRCTDAPRRSLKRHVYEDALERMNARFEDDPGLLRLRRCTVEHPFGTIKRMSGGGRYLTRGLPKVKTEMALSVLAYNLIRASNLIGRGQLAGKLA